MEKGGTTRTYSMKSEFEPIYEPLADSGGGDVPAFNVVLGDIRVRKAAPGVRWFDQGGVVLDRHPNSSIRLAVSNLHT